MKISVIISTYNQPRLLEKALSGYARQTFKGFELVVADDGSGPETAAVIQRFQRESAFSLVHAWHADNGFRKTEILNRAILTCTGDYLVFSDGDCIPRDDFVAVHARLAAPRQFVSGAVIALSSAVSDRIGLDDIAAGRFSSPRWLARNGHWPGRRITRLARIPGLGAVTDALSSASRHFMGSNASVAKNAVVEVNGFDHEMTYGYEDWSLGERLKNAGYRARQARNRAVLLHLDHARSYKTAEVTARNKAIYERIKASGEVRARNGLAEMAVQMASESARGEPAQS